jgi:hypothetical protein
VIDHDQDLQKQLGVFWDIPRTVAGRVRWVF